MVSTGQEIPACLRGLWATGETFVVRTAEVRGRVLFTDENEMSLLYLYMIIHSIPTIVYIQSRSGNLSKQTLIFSPNRVRGRR